MEKNVQSYEFASAIIDYIKIAGVSVRRAIAKDPNTPVDVLEFL